MNRTKTKKRHLSLQPLESRRVLAASLGWDGPGLGSAELTYNIANHPSSLTQAQTNAAIETAFAAWSNVADIKFTPTDQSGLRDSIDISFTNIDGPGRTLAQAYFPDDVNPARIAGDVQFDLSEVWEVGNSLGNRAFDLVWVAVHEIGHSLGLDHSGAIDSVLASFVSPNQSFTSLSANDTTAIRGLYAAAEGSVATPPVATTTTNPPVVETPTQTPTTPFDPGDTDDDPFPRHRWRRGGFWFRFGGRLETDTPDGYNLYNPTDVNGDNATTASDALTIINQLNRIASGDDSAVVGMCDTNGDGIITASDALVVINAMNTSYLGSGETGTSAILDDSDITTVGVNKPIDDTPVEDTPVDDTPVDDTPMDPVDEVIDTTDETPTDSVDQTDDPVTSVDEPVVDTTDDPVDEVVDTATDTVDDPVNTVDPADDTDTSETPTDNTDPVTDPTDSVDDVDDGDETDETIDDGGLTDENGDCHDGSRDHGRHRGGHHGRGLDHGLIPKSGDALLARFDADASGSLSEDEVPARIWDLLVSQNVNADADTNGFVTADEIDAALTAARKEKVAEKFAAKDTDANGLLTEDEVSTRLWSRLADADTDAEAGISLDEFEAFVASKRTDPETSGKESPLATRFANVDHAFAQLGRERFQRSRH